MVLGPIDSWTSQTLDELISGHWQESIVLEFKRQLGTARGDKKEIAKDITAMANTAGGWIVYGIDEQPNSQGIKVAHAVVPLTDADTGQRIDDIVAESISPPVRYRSKTIPYGAGACVVLRVERSTTALHMVHAYDDYRYYRRTELAARPMGESEVRQALEQLIRQQNDGERWTRDLFDQVRDGYTAPYGWLAVSTGIRDERLDPRTINRELLRRFLHHAYDANVGDIGLRATIDNYAYDFGIARDASTWIEFPIAVHDDRFRPAMVIDHLVRLGAVTWHLWQQHGVAPLAPRLGLQLECAAEMRAIDCDDAYEAPTLRKSKWLSFQITSEDLRDGGRARLARLVADRIYQVMGCNACPFFDDNGILRPEATRTFPKTPW